MSHRRLDQIARQAVRQHLLAIYHGDDVAPAGDEDRGPILQSESGMVTFVTLIAVLFCLILMALIGNVGNTINRKIETQNSADSVAYTAAAVRARELNMLTAINHVLGEITAMAVLHHAIGGPEFDSDSGEPPEALKNTESVTSQHKQQMKIASQALDLAFQAADALKSNTVPGEPSSDVKDAVNDEDDEKTGATLFFSALRLRQVLASAYAVYAVGAALQKAKEVPYVGPILFAIGVALCTAALLIEFKVRFERIALDLLRTAADSLRSAKFAVLQSAKLLIPLSQSLRGLAAGRVVTATRQVAQATLATSAIFPKQPGLPVVTEPADAPIERSQLLRAAYPWVNSWRAQPLDWFYPLLFLARGAYLYRHFSDRYTAEICDNMRQDDVTLPILRDYDPKSADPKGQEPWATGDFDRADAYFGVAAFARRSRPRLAFAGPGFFKSANLDGFVTYAQGMTYNGNAQRGVVSADRQAVVGWDTLNWSPSVGVPEFTGIARFDFGQSPGRFNSQLPDLGYKRSSDPLKQTPQIFLNWRAKLTPVTMLGPASGNTADGIINKVTRRLRDRQSFRTH